MAQRVVADASVCPSREVIVEADQETATVDGAMVERILENLVVNAEKHTPDGVRIWIRVARTGEGALLTVDDEGTGIPEDLRERIFEPFLRGPNAPAHAPGVGVGLSLVAQFARLHGGRAWVEARPEGGSSFRVLLPDGDAELSEDLG